MEGWCVVTAARRDVRVDRDAAEAGAGVAEAQRGRRGRMLVCRVGGVCVD
jgi:hypothetical protein